MLSLKDEIYFAKHKETNKFFFGGTGKMGFKNSGSLKLSMNQRYGEQYKNMFDIYKMNADMKVTKIEL